MRFSIWQIVRPCVFCGNKDIKEYMVNDKISFMACDKCNVAAPCGDTTFKTAKNWNKIMKRYKEIGYGR